jgi:transposase-like protein
MDDLKGKARCPACGSTHIIYNNVSDYYRCNKCKRLFFTPGYGPGDEPKNRTGNPGRTVQPAGRT